MAGRILVIRGGAIGDFILTLPAIGLLRQNFPEAHIEILGYRHITSLAERRYYADATRSIEYGPLAGFFNPKADLDRDLSDYFGGFQQVVSYIYDPDQLFETSLRKAGVRNLISVSPKITDADHAASQLALPLQQMALWLEDPAAEFFPSPEDLQTATQWVEHRPDSRVLAVHPGSGGERKNWPLAAWQEFIAAEHRSARWEKILIVGGESDTPRLTALRSSLPADGIAFLESISLPVLGAVLGRSTLFVGHDSGISHLAAAAGARCLLMFGPTDPQIWAPANDHVAVLTAPAGDLSALDVAAVRRRVDEILQDVR